MKKIALILITLTMILSLSALEIPRMRGRINDYANILMSNEESTLEHILAQEETKTSSQFVLLTVPSLEGENLEDYSIRVASEWGIGQKDRDNGVLLLVALNEKKIRIEVGYGLEPILTDVKSGYIIRNFIVPEFKSGNYFQGIAAGLNAITGLVSQEYEISDEELAQYQKKEKQGKRPQIPIGTIIFFIMIFFGGFGRRRRGGLLPLLLLGSTFRDSGRGGGFGGSGFGGFSGGGGGFGGGGASGGW